MKGRSYYFIVILFMFVGTTFVHGVLPFSNELDTQGMVMIPKVREETFTINPGGGVSLRSSSKNDYSDHFFKFSVPNNSSGTMIIEFDLSYQYSPYVPTGEIGIGETWSSNCTWIGTFAESESTLYYDISFSLGTGDNATMFFTHIIWDYPVYKMGVGGYIGFSIAGVVIVILLVLFLKPKRKEYANV